MRPSVPRGPRNWPLRRLAGKVPSCRPTASIDCRFEVRDFAPGRAGADPAPWGIGARGWRRICSPDLFLSPPRRSRLRRGLCFQKTEYWDQLPSLSSESNAKTPRRAFCAGATLSVFSWDTLFCLYGKVSYPGFRAHHAKVTRNGRWECEKRGGKCRESGAGNDRDSLQVSGAVRLDGAEL